MAKPIAIEEKICPVTGKTFQTGFLYNSKNKKAFDEDSKITGFQLMPSVAEYVDKGYVAIVGVDPKKSKLKNGSITPMNAHRTGKAVFIKNEVFKKSFKMEVPEEGFIYTEDSIVDKFTVKEETKDPVKKKRKYTKKKKKVEEDVPNATKNPVTPKRKYTKRRTASQIALDAKNAKPKRKYTKRKNKED